MPNVDNVSTGKPKIGGAVYRAALGTTLPTDATTALASAFEEMGFISDDGVVNSNNPTTNKILSWGGQTVLVVTTEKPDTFQLTFLEPLNANVLETVYGEDFDLSGQGIRAAFVKLVGLYDSGNSSFHLNELRVYGTEV